MQTDCVIKGVRETARAKAVQLQILKASTEGEIDAAFGTLMQLQAVMLPPTSMLNRPTSE